MATTESEVLNPLVAQVGRVLAEAGAAREGVAVLLVRCGAVERIDAQQGFHAGDRLSSHIAKVLRTQGLRKGDLLVPVSREEFACILRPVASEGVATLAAHRMLNLLASPVAIGNESIAADATVGFATYPQHGEEAEVLLQRAKAALLRAHDERDRLYQHHQGDSPPATDALLRETRLRLAIEQNALNLYFQPQMDLRTGRIIGAEALLRWHDEVLGEVPPSVAVATAESSGLVDKLSLWVITSAVQQCARFQRSNPEFTVSVNVSPSNLRETDLPFYFDRALRTWGVPGERIVVEITETAMLSDQALANEALRELKSHGIRLSIDDFGTGYSSMYYLAQLPLDELKIDLMFVRGMFEIPHYAKIVRSLVELAHNLELTVVAEGVESEAIQSALGHLRCDRAQGYHIGKPVPAKELIARLQGDGGRQVRA